MLIDHHYYYDLEEMYLLCVATVVNTDPLAPALPTVVPLWSPITALTSSVTDSDMKANHGLIFETIEFLVVVILGLGAYFVYLPKKQATAAFNNAKSEC